MSIAPGAGLWRAGIFAAGWGERLRPSTAVPKPLVTVGGRALIDHVLGSMAEAAPSEVVILINEQATAVRDHVASESWPFALRWIVETTPSSMHSFLRVVEALGADGSEGPFLISTVDTIAPRGAFAGFAAASRNLDADVVLAVAPPSGDEKPLLVEVGADGVTVSAIGSAVRLKPDTTSGPSDARRARGRSDDGGRSAVFATSGYYAVHRRILRAADAARRAGVPALRAFLARLLSDGYRIAALPVASGVDVDRGADISAAEAFLNQRGA